MRTEGPAEACLCAAVCFILVGWCVASCTSERAHENRETNRGVSVCGGVFHSGWLVCCILQIRELIMLEYIDNRETFGGVFVCGGVSFWLVGVLHSANPRVNYVGVHENRETRGRRVCVRWCVSFWLIGVLHSANPRVHENRETRGGVSVCGGVFHSGWLVCYIL